MAGTDASEPIPFRDATRVWLRVAAQSFGGPAGQIAVMHRILVEEKRWVSERRFLHALNYCMLLPGPEAMQLATYIGWLLHGTRGGLVAGGLFVLPGFLAILALSIVYALYAQVGVVEAAFVGLKAAVLAIVVHAVIRIGRRAVRNAAMLTVAVSAFVAIFLLDTPFPLIVAGAALVGLVGDRFAPRHFEILHRPGADDEGLADRAARGSARPRLGTTLRVAGLWAGIWLVPVALLVAALGTAHILAAEGIFFSKVALVTFGGAYAVLAYVAQEAVQTHGWLQPGEMLDGLGMAETTPGPLIQVVQFVGFLAAYRNPMGLDPLVAGILGSIVVTWVTFAPCFLYIFTGAPYIEHLRGNKRLTAALSAVTAAVVGVIVNLAAFFLVHTLFADVGERTVAGVLHVPVVALATISWPALASTGLAFALMFGLGWGIARTLLGCTVFGVVLWALL